MPRVNTGDGVNRQAVTMVAVSFLAMVGCARSSLREADSPDSGGPAANEGDSGFDAGRPPDEPPDGGVFDAGGPDAGGWDAGTRDAGHFDAGACAVAGRATLAELSLSPRAVPGVEQLVLHGAPWLFVVDDATYARADRELAALAAADAGPFRAIPEWAPDLELQLDDAGVAALQAGQFHEWDCLNWYYRASVSSLFFNFVFITPAPIVSSPRLAQDYAALPHVVSATPDFYFACAACGCTADGCLDLVAPDAGTWTWLWYTESSTCERSYLRMRTEADGGVGPVERWTDGGLPRPWLDENPRCWDQLWSARFHRDGG